ncbi:unnamed protein product, partial [Gulo gulo]
MYSALGSPCLCLSPGSCVRGDLLPATSTVPHQIARQDACISGCMPPSLPCSHSGCADRIGTHNQTAVFLYSCSTYLQK